MELLADAVGTWFGHAAGGSWHGIDRKSLHGLCKVAPFLIHSSSDRLENNEASEFGEEHFEISRRHCRFERLVMFIHTDV